MVCKKAQKLTCAFLHASVCPCPANAPIGVSKLLKRGDDRAFLRHNNRMFVLGDHAFFCKEGPVVIFNLENFLFEC